MHFILEQINTKMQMIEKGKDLSQYPSFDEDYVYIKKHLYRNITMPHIKSVIADDKFFDIYARYIFD